jgi:hypothetical protein
LKPRIYIDTSVIGGCFDEEFAIWSIRLFDEIRSKSKVAVIADITLRELESAPENVRSVLSNLPRGTVEKVYLKEESEQLASNYIKHRVVGKRNVIDAQHIAIASVEKVDVMVSWNFHHIVNLNRIRAFNAINLLLGYPMLEIRSPREVVYEEGV